MRLYFERVGSGGDDSKVERYTYLKLVEPAQTYVNITYDFNTSDVVSHRLTLCTM